jgi:hypothetical protein
VPKLHAWPFGRGPWVVGVKGAGPCRCLRRNLPQRRNQVNRKFASETKNPPTLRERGGSVTSSEAKNQSGGSAISAERQVTISTFMSGVWLWKVSV